jgi:anthranilate phosphoribosyltransferase
MLKEMIKKLMAGHDLTLIETQAAVSKVISGAPVEQTAAFLVLLHAKGETPEELQGLVNGMKAEMQTVTPHVPVLDIVGTGGDQANTVNISTASSLLAAACGANVVKHGNRSVSSRCGSADLLAALGVRLETSAEQVSNDLDHNGFAFCFAPSFHPAMKALKAVRKVLGVRTSFNLIGPLLNPAKAQHLLIGVFSPDYLDLIADTLMRLGVTHAMVVHSCGLDELSLIGPSEVIELHHGKKQSTTLDPKDLGFDYYPLEAIQGGDVTENKRLIMAALTGTPGAIADTIVLNTGVALYVADCVPSMAAGIALAKEKIKTGEALKMIGKDNE